MSKLRKNGWSFFLLLCLVWLGVACGGTASTEEVPTLVNIAEVPTEAPTLLPTSTLPPTSTPVTPVTMTPTQTPLPDDAAATPLSTLPPTNTIATPAVIPTHTRAIPTNTPRIPTSTFTPLATFTFTPSPTPTVTNTPTPNPIVWQGEYFNNRDLSGAAAAVRDDANLSFNWGTGTPINNLPVDNFSVRWTRVVQLAPATYRFYARADDGVRIWIDNEQIINEWHDATPQTYSVERTVAAGNHTIKVEYFENIGTAQIQVWWEQSGQFPQWRGEYFNNATLSGAVVLLRNDADINFNWAGSAPDSSLPSDNFSARWTRTMSFNAGHYRFSATVDDGARVYLDSVLIIDEWRDGSERTVTVELDVTAATHLLQVEYYDRSGDARIRVWWEFLNSGYPDWQGEYWTNTSLNGTPTVTRNDVAIDFDWGTGAPANGIPADNFSVRWTRTVNLTGGRYRFHTEVDDGVRVYIDGNLIINEWHGYTAPPIYEAEVNLGNGNHAITVEYLELEQGAWISFTYQRIGD